MTRSAPEDGGLCQLTSAALCWRFSVPHDVPSHSPGFALKKGVKLGSVRIPLGIYLGHER